MQIKEFSSQYKNALIFQDQGNAFDAIKDLEYVDTRDEGEMTPLNWAVTMGATEIALLLVDLWANVESQSIHGKKILEQSSSHTYLSAPIIGRWILRDQHNKEEYAKIINSINTICDTLSSANNKAEFLNAIKAQITEPTPVLHGTAIKPDAETLDALQAKFIKPFEIKLTEEKSVKTENNIF